jgi:rRNA maturation endonuclease Nob1
MYLRLLRLIIFLTACFAFGTTCQAASVTLSMPTIEGATGAQVKCPVLVKEAQGVGALEMEITYDPSIIEPQEVEPGPILSGLVEFNVIQRGRLKVAMATSQAVNGSGKIFIVTLKVLSPGQSRLGLENVLVWERASSKEMAVTLEPGVFKTSSGASFPSAGLIASGVILVLLFAALAWFIIRKKSVAESVDARTQVPAPVTPTKAARQQGSEPSSLAADGTGSRQCSRCGKPLSHDSKFCSQCGAQVSLLPDSVNCAECGRSIPRQSKFCKYCGKTIQLALQCGQCGETIEGDSKFCQMCGTPVARPSAAPKSENCPACCKKLTEASHFCPDCGAKVF